MLLLFFLSIAKINFYTDFISSIVSFYCNLLLFLVSQKGKVRTVEE